MADPSNPIQQLGEDADSTTLQIRNLGEEIEEAVVSKNAALGTTASAFLSIHTAAGSTVGQKGMNALSTATGSVAQAANKAKQSVLSMAQQIQAAQPLINTLKKIGIEVDDNEVVAKFGKLSSETLPGLKRKLMDAFAGGSPVAIIKATKEYADFKKIMGDFTGYNEAQKALMGFNDTIEKIGMGLGKSRDDMVGFRGAAKENLVATMEHYKVSADEATKMMGGFGDALNPQEATEGIEVLRDKISGLGDTAINPMNVALAVAKGRNIENAKAAELYSEAMLKLGMNQQDAARMFGNMELANKKVGLSYNTTSSTIMEASKDLKFFGMTTNEMSGVFSAFGGKLNELGKKGLAPELFKSYIGGLRGMSMATKGFLSMQVPGMAKGGPLAGALEVEEALATGEGIGKLTKGMMGMVSRTTGAEVMTRKEALESGRGRQYELQRQVLSRMTNITDTAALDQMIPALRAVEEAVSEKDKEKAEKELQNIMQEAQQSQDGNLTMVNKNLINIEKAIYSQGSGLVNNLGGLFDISGVDDIVSRLASGSNPFELMRETMGITPEALKSGAEKGNEVRHQVVGEYLGKGDAAKAIGEVWEMDGSYLDKMEAYDKRISVISEELENKDLTRGERARLETESAELKSNKQGLSDSMLLEAMKGRDILSTKELDNSNAAEYSAQHRMIGEMIGTSDATRINETMERLDKIQDSQRADAFLTNRTAAANEAREEAKGTKASKEDKTIYVKVEATWDKNAGPMFKKMAQDAAKTIFTESDGASN